MSYGMQLLTQTGMAEINTINTIVEYSWKFSLPENDATKYLSCPTTWVNSKDLCVIYSFNAYNATGDGSFRGSNRRLPLGISYDSSNHRFVIPPNAEYPSSVGTYGLHFYFYEFN